MNRIGLGAEQRDTNRPTWGRRPEEYSKKTPKSSEEKRDRGALLTKKIKTNHESAKRRNLTREFLKMKIIASEIRPNKVEEGDWFSLKKENLKSELKSRKPRTHLK